MDPAGIVIRTGLCGDASLLADLGARTFRDTFASDNTEADMASYLEAAFAVEVQERELAQPGSTFLLAFVDSVIAGYARLRMGDAPVCVRGSSPVEIVRLYSDAPWIGAGVGSALMRACLDHATSMECDVVWLDVWERNPRAIGFYRKWGFEVVGEQEFVLGNDIQRDLLMARCAGG